MENILPVIRSSLLFTGMEDSQILDMLACLSAKDRTYAKGEYLIREGDPVADVGVVLAGSVHVIREDFWGNRNIIAVLETGDVFGESYACAGSAPSGVSVVALEATQVLTLNAQRALTSCASACAFHSALIRNLVSMLAVKNLRLNEKLVHVTQRNTREKLLAFLSSQSLQKGAATFEIPFNRQELADYLSVDRSAMSLALCKLRDEGMLAFHRNRFTLRPSASVFQIPR